MAAVLRLARLGRPGLWSDECLTANWAALRWGEIAGAVQADNNAPLFFWFEKAALAAVGGSEAGVRLLPAVIGIATVLLVFVVGARLISDRGGLLAALLLAASPMHVAYSQEGRNYSLLALLCLLALALAEAVRDRPTAGRAAALALACAALLYSHPLGVVYCAGILAATALVPPVAPRALRSLGLAAALAALAFAPWLPRLMAQTGRVGASFGWGLGEWRRDFPWQIPRSLAAMTHGSLAPIRSSVWDILPSAWAGLGLVALVVVAAWRRQAAGGRALVMRLGTAIMLPLLALFAVSLARAPVYVVGRTDSPLAPLLMLLIAAAADGLSAPIRRWVPVALIGLAIFPLEAHLRLDTKSQERSIATVLRSLAAPREPLVSTVFHPCLVHYGGFREGADLMSFPAGLSGIRDWVDGRVHPPAVLPMEAASLAGETLDRARGAGARRVWALSQRGPAGAALVAAFDARFGVAARREIGFPGTELRCYLLPPPSGAHPAS